MKNRMWVLAAALPVALAAGAAHAESALTAREVALQAEAQADAPTLATLAAETKVDVLLRRGAWSQVKTGAGQTGWLRMMSLKAAPNPNAAPTQTASANPLGALGGLLNAGRSDNSATVTTGVRGLSEEDLQNAQANPAELEKMQKFGVDKKAGQAFAQRSKLAPASVEYLPEPAPQAAPTSVHNPEGG